MSAIKSQPIKWHGGKSYLASWLHSLAPPSCVDDPANGYTHRNIVFAGGLGEFWNWQPIDGISETVNDCNSGLTNFYEVLGDCLLADAFIRELQMTPLSQGVWERSLNETLSATDPSIGAAKAFFLKYRQSRQGLGKDYTTPTTRTRRGMNEQVSAWLSAVDGLPECHERLRRVEIRNLDCIDFIQKYDHPRALFYCDPPYLHETRATTGEYEHEMTAEQHEHLLNTLAMIQGKFMLSGYHSQLYDQWQVCASNGFRCHERTIDNKASSKKTKDKRIECVWCNY